MLAAAVLPALASFTEDLARPVQLGAEQLSTSPNIWLTHDFLSPSAVAHLVSKVPKEESAFSPCIGQTDEFDSKKCTHVPIKGDEVLEAALAKIEHTWNVDVAKLHAGGLPIIRYLPGAPQVGKHGDEDQHGVVPNATLVMYLTKASGGVEGGRTIFPEADVSITPRMGSVLSFQNVDGVGSPHPRAKHLVSAVPADAAGDRLVAQIPIAVERTGDGQLRRHAYPEHVSGAKKPGQHEKMHGNDAQKNAYKAAAAAGMSIAVAYMAAKAGKFEEGDEAELKKAAEDTGKFSDEDFVAGSAK